MGNETVDMDLDDQFAHIFSKQDITTLVTLNTGGIEGLIGYLADPRDDIASDAAAALKKLVPMAAMTERWADDTPFKMGESHGVPDWIVESGRHWGTVDDFPSLCLREYLRLQGDRKKSELFLERLVNFPGAERRFTELLRGRGEEGAAEHFRKLLETRQKIIFPPQLGLSPTMNCQLHCGYCVSAGHQQLEEITWDAVLDILDWAKRNSIGRIGFCGGEPTLYSRFIPLLELLAREGFEWYMATNGLIADKVLGVLCRNRPMCVTMHLTPEVFESNLIRAFKANAARLVLSGVNVVLRMNIHRADMDPASYLDIAVDTGIKEVRCAVPMPNATRHNSYISPEEFHAYGDALGRYEREGRKRGLKTILAKPFPLCQMPEDAAKAFIANGSMAENCPAHVGNYANNIVVMPDTTYIPCLGLNHRSPRSLTRYATIKAAGDRCKEEIVDLSAMPLFELCTHCPFWRGGRCLGGCLSYRLSDQDGP